MGETCLVRRVWGRQTGEGDMSDEGSVGET